MKVRKLNDELKKYYYENNIEPTHKWCRTCEEKLNIESFITKPGQIFGVNGNCRQCEVVRVGIYNQAHKEERIEYKDEYWGKHGPRINLERSDRYHSDPVYQEKMKTEDSVRRKTEPYKKNRNIRRKNRYNTDEDYRTKSLLRGRLTDVVSGRQAGFLRKRACEYGIDWAACIAHLGPRPDNINFYHIDHIVPCSCFDFTNPSHPAICFHPTNLRWALADENLAKNDTIYPELIEQYNLHWIVEYLNLDIDEWNSKL